MLIYDRLAVAVRLPGSRRRVGRMGWFGLCLAVALSGPAIGQAVKDVAPRPKLAFLGIRLLKVAGAGKLSWTVDMPPGCTDCRIVANDRTAGQNDKDVFFHLWVPVDAQGIGAIHVGIDAAKIRGVVASYTDLELAHRGYATDKSRAVGLAKIAFTPLATGIAFAVPTQLTGVSMPPDDLTDVTQIYTYIETPGVYLRIGHADPARRGGAYASGRWPAREAAAALNLEFATREAIAALHLERQLPKLGVRTIMLMNFDTNYPTLGPDEAHEDWPPHWHMHLYWTDTPRIRKVGHFYLSADGSLSQILSDQLQAGPGTPRRKRWYHQGETDETRTPAGDLVYAQSITRSGAFKLTTTEGTCLLTPAQDGFDSGVTVRCDNGSTPITVRATDDLDEGRIVLYRDGRLAESYRYDSDTGGLLDSPG